MNRCRCASLLLALAAVLAGPSLAAQPGGGRRGPPPEVRERWGNYFTTIELGTDDQKLVELDQTEHVKAAAAAGHLSLLYLYDASEDPKQHASFEQTLFNHNRLRPGLRLFLCARVDLARHPIARQRYGKAAPLFVVFDKSGKQVGLASMAGYKPAPVPLLRLLNGATRNYSRVTFDNWIKSYDKWLRDLTNMDAHQRILDGKRERLAGASSASHRKQLEKVESDEARLHQRREAHMAKEAQMLERAKVPARNPSAVLVGEPQFRRRR